MRVLLFSNDLMPFGNLPTSGGGLRAWQIYQGLKHCGHEVIASMPGFTFLAQKFSREIPEEQKTTLWTFPSQDSLVRRLKPDAVVFTSNWDHFNLSSKIDVPVIVDLHGSRLVETSMWGTPASSERKVQVLSRADCLITAGRRQRLYFYGWLVQAGRIPTDEHFIRYIPISLSPELPPRSAAPQEQSGFPHFVSGGGWFPWQNQSRALFTICEQVASRNAGSIEIFGTPHEKGEGTPEELRILEVFSKIKKLSEANSRVQVQGYIGREDLLKIYARANVAVEAMEYNLERELAFTTRTIEYLWCGLPVLYNNFSEVSEHIRDYDAGWLVDPKDPGSITQAVSEIFENPEVVLKKSENAMRLVRDRFTWDKTIAPLEEYLQNPVRAKSLSPLTGVVQSRPSYFLPRGEPVDVVIPTSDRSNLPIMLVQKVTVPSDHSSGLEFSLKRQANVDTKTSGLLIVNVRRQNGQLLSHKSISLFEAVTAGEVKLPFAPFRRPSGGEVLLVEMEVNSANSKPVEFPIFAGIQKATYPLLPLRVKTTQGEVAVSPAQSEMAIAIRFLPMELNRWSHLQVVVRRGMTMIRNKEWRRVAFAVRRRLPASVDRIVDRVLS